MSSKTPWSKQHKKITRGAPLSFSNSFAQPLTMRELVELTEARGDHALLDEFHLHALDYTPTGGSLDLRTTIAGFYGEQISADNILVFAGGQVALQTCACALLTRADHAIVFTPGYQSVQQAPVFADAEVTSIRLKAEHGWQIQIAEVKAAIRSNTRYLVINEPSNPSGSLMRPALQQQLVALAERHSLHIMSDEVYRHLEHDPRTRLPAMADIYARGISLCTMSKPWGACGVTIGWLALQDLKLKQQCIDVLYFGSACPARASELQSMMTLRASDAILSKNLAIIDRNMQLLDVFFERYAHFFQWVRPTAGAVAFVKFSGPMSAAELGIQLASAGISIKPAYVFTDPNDTNAVSAYRDYFRIGFGEACIPNVLAALQDFVEQHQQKWRA